MNVLLLTAVDPFSYQIIPDLGLMYIAQAARLAGHRVTIRDPRRQGWDVPTAAREAAALTPQVVGLKSYSNEAKRVAEMARAIRAALPRAVIVIGGPHASMDPAAALGLFDAADYVMAGEAETSFPALLDWLQAGAPGLPPETITGLAYRSEGQVVTRPPVLQDDLDLIPLPAWDLMPPSQYPDEAAGVFVPAFPAAPMLLSRGCPCQCAYCGCRRISGTKIRYRSAANILQEIDLLVREYGTRTFTFVDDNFTCSRRRSMELFESLARRPDKIFFTFPNGVRADSLDEEMVKVMEAAGCYSLALGIESGSNRTLQAMNKKQTIELVEEKVKLVRETTKIKVTGFFILGYPGETLKDVRDTIDFATRLPIHNAHFCIFIPIPGTPIFDQLREQGVIDPQTTDYELLTIDKPSLQLPGLPMDKLLRLHQGAYLKFYARPWRTLNMLSQFKSPGHIWSVFRRFTKLFR